MCDNYKRFVDAKEMRADYGDLPTPARQMQETLEIALLAHAKGSESLNREMAYELAVALGQLLDGRNPMLLQNNAKVGNPKKSRETISLIKDAVRYIKVCDAGLLSDPRPRNTVIEAFDVAPSTVSKWMKEFKDASAPNDIEIVRTLMEKAGERYQFVRKQTE